LLAGIAAELPLMKQAEYSIRGYAPGEYSRVYAAACCLITDHPVGGGGGLEPAEALFRITFEPSFQPVFNLDQLFFSIRYCAYRAPHRRWPAGIRFKPGNVMDMQLRYDVSQGGNIKFIGMKNLFQAVAEKYRFGE